LALTDSIFTAGLLLKVADHPQDPLCRAPVDDTVGFEVPLEDKDAVSADMDVTRRMVGLPRHEDVPASADPGHR
jgi:hypothetical protein